MKHVRVGLLILLTVIFPRPRLALAIAGTDEIRGPISPADARSKAWPDNSLPLMNDPRRIRAWWPWFSEAPNDVYYFAYQARSMDDVNQLIALLAEIKSDQVVVALSPQGGGQQLTRDGPRMPAPVELCMVSQKEADDWFNHLGTAGRKKFGVTTRPIVQPPTMTLYLGDPMLDLTRLVLPPRVTLKSGVSPRDQNDAKHDPALAQQIEQIDLIVVDYNAKHPATLPAKMKSAPSQS
jgi:hypothetical protein